MKSVPRDTHELEFTLAEALDILFRSGHNILRFYAMRNALLDSPADAADLLGGMKRIVQEEIENSLRLSELCLADPRLGYHSEAEVYKFFPEKLKWRAKLLKRLLTEDFAEAENVLKSGGNIGEFLCWKEEIATEGKVYGENGIHWSFESDCDSVTFHLDFDSSGNNSEIAFLLFCDRKGEHPSKWAKITRKDATPTATGWHEDYTISRLLLNQDSVFFFGVEKHEFLPDGRVIYTNDRKGDFMHEDRLNLLCFSADKVRRIELKK